MFWILIGILAAIPVLGVFALAAIVWTTFNDVPIKLPDWDSDEMADPAEERSAFAFGLQEDEPDPTSCRSRARS